MADTSSKFGLSNPLRSWNLRLLQRRVSILIAISVPLLGGPPTIRGQILSFQASTGDEAAALSEMFDLHTSGAAGLSFFTDPVGPAWYEWRAITNLPVGYAGSQSLLTSVGSNLRGVYMDSTGEVSVAGGELGGWPFPNYTHSGGQLAGFEFNQNGNTQGWTVVNGSSTPPSNGIWHVNTPSADPRLLSPTLSVSASQTAFVEFVMRSTSPSQTATLYWRRQGDSNWTTAQSISISLRNDGQLHAYRFPVYTNTNWNGTIRFLRLDPLVQGGPGEFVDIDRIGCSYDSRLSDMNSTYVLAAHRYYSWTGDVTVFTLPNTPQGSIFDRTRLAIRFLQTELGGDANSFILVPWRGHDGLPGKVNGQINYGHGVQSSIWDALPIGHKDAYASVHYYAALRAMSQLELERERHPEWGLPANPFGESSATFAAKADSVRGAIYSTFWLATQGRLMLCRDINNAPRDYGHTALNLEAVVYGALDAISTDRAMRWITGQDLVAGDVSQGTDIYAWGFGPRATTQDTSSWYVWPMYIWFGIETAPPFGAQVQNGGAWLYASYFDVVARVRSRGADSAWSRLKDMAEWFQDTQAAGGYAAYYLTHPGVLQCEGAGSLGIECEFPESALAPLSFLYGLLGVDASIDGLRIKPAIPSHMTEIGATRLYFRGHFYDLETSTDIFRRVKISSHEAPGSPLPNSAHTLPLEVGGLDPFGIYELRLLNLDTGVTTTTQAQADIGGFIRGSLSMPARFELTYVQINI